MTAIHLDRQAADDKVLLRHDAGGITTLTLNRPEQFNALSQKLLGELETALAGIALDRAVRVVVLSGAGKAFCAGHDLKEMHDSADPRIADEVFACLLYT